MQLLTLTDKKIHRRTIQSVLGVSIVYSTAFFFFLLFECIPINHFWTRVEGESGFCVAVDTLGALTIVHSVFNISADVSNVTSPHTSYIALKCDADPHDSFAQITILLKVFSSSITHIEKF